MTTGRTPRLLIVTNRSELPPRRTLDSVLTECVSAGACHVLLRERALSPDHHASLVDRLLQLLPADGTLTVASPARPGAGVGLHLRAVDPPPRVRPVSLSRSIHDIAEARRAAAEGCDWVTLSPVDTTASKPGYGPPLGARGIERVRTQVPGCPPILALGGVTPPMVPELRAAGAHGVAVMGGIMRAHDPAAATAELLVALTEPSTPT